MGFQPPTFNLAVNVWRYTTPKANPPNLTTSGNLSFGKTRPTITALQVSGRLWYYPCIDLCLPKGTDIRGHTRPIGQDFVEVPAGTGRYYCAIRVEDVAKGFTNEYRLAIILQLDSELISLLLSGGGYGAGWGATIWPEPTP